MSLPFDFYYTFAQSLIQQQILRATSASMVTSFQTFNSRHINNNGHDDDSVTTWGRHELEDNRQERHRTNNNSTTPANHHNASTTNTKQSTPQKHEFLSPSSSNSSPSSTVGTLKQQETPSEKGVTFSALSPMTNTLNVLSQNMDDLRYDAAVSMLQLDHGETTTNNNDGNDGGNDKVASKNDKVASKKTTLTNTRKHDNDSPFDKEERMKSKAIRQPQSAKSPKSASSESTNPDRFKKIPLNKDKESKVRPIAIDDYFRFKISRHSLVSLFSDCFCYHKVDVSSGSIHQQATSQSQSDFFYYYYCGSQRTRQR